MRYVHGKCLRCQRTTAFVVYRWSASSARLHEVHCPIHTDERLRQTCLHNIGAAIVRDCTVRRVPISNTTSVRELVLIDQPASIYSRGQLCGTREVTR